MRAKLAIVAALTLFLVGCGRQDCSIAGPNWPTDLNGPWLPDHGLVPEVEINLDAKEQYHFSFNGGPEPTRISKAELLELFELLKQEPPSDWFVVRVSPDADCKTVRELRNLLLKLPVCREGGCVQGNVWDRRFSGANGNGPRTD